MTGKTDDYAGMASAFQKQWETALSGWWDQVLESPVFLDAMGKSLESNAKARSQYEHAVEDSLTRLHLPTRGDLTRVARIASLLEDRLLKVEDLLLELKDDLVDRVVKAEEEAVRARIETAETRLELRERLAALEARLEKL
jgi:hypothetical protein